MAAKNTILDQRHPTYQKHHAYWQYFADTYAGGPEYPQKSVPLPIVRTTRAAGSTEARYLWKFPLERSAKYDHRLQRAVTVNITQPVVDFIASIVGKPGHVMIEADPDLDYLLADADRQGQSLAQVLAQARTNALVYGHTFLFVDSTQAQNEIVTQADANAAGVRPYLCEITPDRLLGWRLDDAGQPLEILFETEEEVAGSLLDKREQACSKLYRYWSRDEWRVFRLEKDTPILVLQGNNPLGVVPIVPLYFRRLRAFLGESLLKDAAKIQQLLTNWFSAFDEGMENAMFPMPVWKSRKSPEDAEVGVTMVMHLNPEDGEEFKWVSPDPGPLEACWAAFYRLVQLANTSMGIAPKAITSDAIDAKSGVAKQWDFQELASQCSRLAVNEQEAVLLALEYAARWRKGPAGTYAGTVQYATEYDLNTAEQDLNQLLLLQTAGAPGTARKELMKRVCAKLLTSLPEKTRKKMMTEIDKLPVALPGPGTPEEPPAEEEKA